MIREQFLKLNTYWKLSSFDQADKESRHLRRGYLISRSSQVLDIALLTLLAGSTSAMIYGLTLSVSFFFTIINDGLCNPIRALVPIYYQSGYATKGLIAKARGIVNLLTWMKLILSLTICGSVCIFAPQIAKLLNTVHLPHEVLFLQLMMGVIMPIDWFFWHFNAILTATGETWAIERANKLLLKTNLGFTGIALIWNHGQWDLLTTAVITLSSRLIAAGYLYRTYRRSDFRQKQIPAIEKETKVYLREIFPYFITQLFYIGAERATNLYLGLLISRECGTNVYATYLLIDRVINFTVYPLAIARGVVNARLIREAQESLACLRDIGLLINGSHRRTLPPSLFTFFVAWLAGRWYLDGTRKRVLAQVRKDILTWLTPLLPIVLASLATIEHIEGKGKIDIRLIFLYFTLILPYLFILSQSTALAQLLVGFESTWKRLINALIDNMICLAVVTTWIFTTKMLGGGEVYGMIGISLGLFVGSAVSLWLCNQALKAYIKDAMESLQIDNYLFPG
ncbi:hypothetical protein SAMN05444392_10658 [Seinonella peptonophila]|uniref:Uncharacterized protein n=1 Tax=Seinonella peptonophila TaxID=112248 RepID=A0A1M4Y630_9BACL|nr:hypothetical protein [Seinonella peptonophila]SHF01033.1 hypothetical protein SAMN05444392_10658 [Seinonella peptonophila]